jgi:hypothetical protein
MVMMRMHMMITTMKMMMAAKTKQRLLSDDDEKTDASVYSDGNDDGKAEVDDDCDESDETIVRTAIGFYADNRVWRQR